MFATDGSKQAPASEQGYSYGFPHGFIFDRLPSTINLPPENVRLLTVSASALPAFTLVETLGRTVEKQA
jgi:hypothetical protein